MNCDSCVWKGKQIESIKFDEYRIVISFTDGKGIMIYDNGQSCCETRYIHTDVTDLSYYNNTILNDIDVVDSQYIEDDFDYRIENRVDLIDNLIDWISEATQCKEIMKDDLKYLMGLEDEYIFSSISTNEYIAKSDNLDYFNNLCADMIKFSNKFKKENKKG